MRKLVCGLFLSLDGVAESPDKWQFDFDEQMGEALQSQLDEQDTVLLGRVTYEEWASYWPTSTDEPFASFINSAPKYVVSTTLDGNLEWQNSTLIKENVAEEIRKLKQHPGGAIGTAGSPSLVRFLLQNDLVDELILMVHPVIAGKGKRLFEDNDALKRLTLVDNKTTSSGVAILSYQPLQDVETAGAAE
jgi:dihydrofolate reductase